MLCPKCGTDVGDTMSLCPSCAAKEGRSSSGGSAIGAIRPNVKVVHLKPGDPRRDPAGSDSTVSRDEPPPPPPEEYSEQRFEQSRQFEQRNVPKDQPPPSSASPGKQIEFARAAGFFLIIAAAWALVVLFRSAGDTPLILPNQQEDSPQNFSHIVIHEPKNVIVDGTTIVGMFQLEDLQVPLAQVKASFSTGKNSLEFLYFLPPDQKEIPFKADQPIVRLVLQFSPLKGHFDRERLQSYLIEYLGGEAPLRIVKTYSIRLASFGEVSTLSGNVKNGEKVRGNLREARTEERDGKVLHMNWELTFDTPVQLVK